MYRRKRTSKHNPPAAYDIDGGQTNQQAQLNANPNHDLLHTAIAGITISAEYEL